MVVISLISVFHPRIVGQEWLVTMEDTESYIPEVSEVGSVSVSVSHFWITTMFQFQCLVFGSQPCIVVKIKCC